MYLCCYRLAKAMRLTFSHEQFAASWNWLKSSSKSSSLTCEGMAEPEIAFLTLSTWRHCQPIRVADVNFVYQISWEPHPCILLQLPFVGAPWAAEIAQHRCIVCFPSRGTYAVLEDIGSSSMRFKFVFHYFPFFQLSSHLSVPSSFGWYRFPSGQPQGNVPFEGYKTKHRNNTTESKVQLATAAIDCNRTRFPKCLVLLSLWNTVVVTFPLIPTKYLKGSLQLIAWKIWKRRTEIAILSGVRVQSSKFEIASPRW